jgi:hypothetical protein
VNRLDVSCHTNARFPASRRNPDPDHDTASG